jgi:hypothetical protein
MPDDHRATTTGSASASAAPPSSSSRSKDGSDHDGHKREQAQLRAKRKLAAQQPKSKEQLQKERKRKEHIQATLAKQGGSSSGDRGKHGTPGSHGKSSHAHGSGKKPSQSTSSSATADATKSPSKFQAIFDKRAEGFLVDLKFRNNPPRPPVGPTFVAGPAINGATGSTHTTSATSTSTSSQSSLFTGAAGIESALQKDWSAYLPSNAIEHNYLSKLYCEPDLGVGLYKFAMDLKGCYRVPKRAKLMEEHQKKNKNKNNKGTGVTTVTDEEDADNHSNGNKKKKSSTANKQNTPKGLELHPDDYELLNWTGSKGDTAAERLKIHRERARAMALLESQGLDATAIQQTVARASSDARRNDIQLKNNQLSNMHTKSGFKSRVLKEELQFFMKRTTYLTNDQYRSVHQFKSLADTKREKEEDTHKQLEQLKKESQDPNTIPKTFQAVRKGEFILLCMSQLTTYHV